jgi:mannose-6-phosphate isomerase
LFDYGRQRELHEDNGVAVAHPWPLRTLSRPARLTTERTVLVASRHFVLERIELPEGSSWALLADAETWMLVLDGHAAIGLAAASIGETIFITGGRTSVEVGNNGLSALIAYPASRAVDSLLHKLGEQPGKSVEPPVPQFAGRAEAQT